MAGYAALYGCGGSEADHICHDCSGERHVENGRTRHGGFVKRAKYDDLVAGIDDPAVWNGLIASKDVILLPNISGSVDPGSPKENKGFGNRKVTYGPRTQVWSFFDPEYKGNYDFYNEISKRTDLIPFYLTSSMVHLYDTEATIFASDPVTEDLEEEIYWSVQATVVSKNLPSKHDLKDIEEVFACDVF